MFRILSQDALNAALQAGTIDSTTGGSLDATQLQSLRQAIAMALEFQAFITYENSLDSNGWVNGPDGVRTKGGQRLEFEFSAPIDPGNEDRIGLEAIIAGV